MSYNHDNQPRCRFDGARLVLVSGNLTGWCHRCGAWRQADTGGRPPRALAAAEREKWEHFAEMILKFAAPCAGAEKHAEAAGEGFQKGTDRQ